MRVSRSFSLHIPLITHQYTSKIHPRYICILETSTLWHFGLSEHLYLIRDLDSLALRFDQSMQHLYLIKGNVSSFKRHLKDTFEIQCIIHLRYIHDTFTIHVGYIEDTYSDYAACARNTLCPLLPSLLHPSMDVGGEGRTRMRDRAALPMGVGRSELAAW